jgi:signal transduction histidine kinase
MWRALWTYWGILFVLEWVRLGVFVDAGMVSRVAPVSVFLAAAWGIGSWAGLCVWAFAVAERFPLRGRGRWMRGASVVLIASASVAARDLVSFHAAPRMGLPMRTDLASFVLSDHPQKALMWLALAGIGYAFDHARRAREAEALAAQVELDLVRSRLETLKGQLQPRFLFDTLHSISALVYRDPAEADRLLARLGHLLRASLAGAGVAFVPLREELDFLEGYLHIERMRLGGRLRASVEADAAAAELPVPHLVLQPLVENAIRHAVGARREGGGIAVRAAIDGATLRLSVGDDGPGLAADGPPGEGAGLANLRARLGQLYGGGASLEVTDGAAGGVLAVVRIPAEVAVGGDERCG